MAKKRIDPQPLKAILKVKGAESGGDAFSGEIDHNTETPNPLDPACEHPIMQEDSSTIVDQTHTPLDLNHLTNFFDESRELDSTSEWANAFDIQTPAEDSQSWRPFAAQLLNRDSDRLQIPATAPSTSASAPAPAMDEQEQSSTPAPFSEKSFRRQGDQIRKLEAELKRVKADLRDSKKELKETKKELNTTKENMDKRLGLANAAAKEASDERKKYTKKYFNELNEIVLALQLPFPLEMEDATGVGCDEDDDYRLWKETFKSIRKGQIKPQIHTHKEPNLADFSPEGAKACVMVNEIRKENAYLQRRCQKLYNLYVNAVEKIQDMSDELENTKYELESEKYSSTKHLEKIEPIIKIGAAVLNGFLEKAKMTVLSTHSSLLDQTIIDNGKFAGHCADGTVCAALIMAELCHITRAEEVYKALYHMEPDEYVYEDSRKQRTITCQATLRTIAFHKSSAAVTRANILISGLYRQWNEVNFTDDQNIGADILELEGLVTLIVSDIQAEGSSQF